MKKLDKTDTLDCISKLAGCDWYVDDGIEGNAIYMYDKSKVYIKRYEDGKQFLMIEK